MVLAYAPDITIWNECIDGVRTHLHGANKASILKELESVISLCY